MRYHDLLIGVRDLRFIPWRQFGRNRPVVEVGENKVCGLPGKNQAFQQGVAGHAIGPVQAGASRLTQCQQPRDVGAGLVVSEDAAAGIVGGRHHGDRIPGDVDAEFEAAAVDRGEVAPDEIGRSVGDVKKNAIRAQSFHFMVDGAGDDVPGRQFDAIIEPMHEG